jgi:site-specific DNA recombinase
MLSDCYLRKSLADLGKSVSRQERDWLHDCTSEGFERGRTFVDPDLSASRYRRKDRPDYAALVGHIREGNCQMLSMWETSRGSREMGEWVALLDLCRHHGVLIRIFGGDPQTFDPRKTRDREALLREGINSESESETIARRSRDGARDLAFAGKPPGPLLFGYTRTYDERGKFKSQDIHPERAAILRRLATDTLDGLSLNGQAQRLNVAGAPSPLGGKWTGAGIARMLKNPGYCGKRRHNGEIVADAVWTPLLTPDEHRKLCALLDTHGRRDQSPDSSLAHMLSGGAKCGVCMHRLRTQRALRYVCNQAGCQGVSAVMRYMDKVVSDHVRDRLRHADTIHLFKTPGGDGELKRAQDDLRELTDHLAGFVEQAAQRKLSGPVLATVESRVRPQIEAAERRVKKLSTPAILADYADIDVPTEWPNLPPTIQREFVLATAEVILSPCGKGGRWSIWRLANSRWLGDELTWGDHWSGLA